MNTFLMAIAAAIGVLGIGVLSALVVVVLVRLVERKRNRNEQDHPIVGDGAWPKTTGPEPADQVPDDDDPTKRPGVARQGQTEGDVMVIRNHTTPEGHELGFHLARLCDDAEPKARLRMPELPPRCNSCAFRAGRHLANGSPATQLDALKCVIEGREFYCHEPAREGLLCFGWVMFMLAMDEGDQFRQVPWPMCGGADPSDERG